MEANHTVPDPLPVLLDVSAVARLLKCSTRHVQRLGEAGLMPPAVKLGALSRWPKSVIEAWITGGCKPVRAAVAGEVRHG